MAREVEALRAIDSPLIARVLDADVDADEPWFAMEFVPGTTLGRLVADSGPLTSETLMEFARGLASCLVATERAGVIHRDLKPANVMVSREGVRLIDFGVANYSEATKLTQTGDVVGTMCWMAPEQLIDEEATSATDVHAWGLLVHFAATGTPAVSAGSPAATIYQILNVIPELPDGLPTPLADLVERALHKEPTQRPAAAQLLAALSVDAQATGAHTNHFVMGHGNTAPASPNLPRAEASRPGQSRRRTRFVVQVGAIVVAVLGVAAYVNASSSPVGDPDETAAPAASTTPLPSPSPSASSIPAPTTAEPQPTVTVTKTSEPSTATADKPIDEPVSDGSQDLGQEPKPVAWPLYEYVGPFQFDVCLQPDFPSPGQLLKIGAGQEGGTDSDAEIIRSAQAGLRSLNYGKPAAVDVTGYFGPATEAALTSFQTRKGLVQDGQLGQQSWSELHYWVNYYAGNCF